MRAANNDSEEPQALRPQTENGLHNSRILKAGIARVQERRRPQAGMRGCERCSHKYCQRPKLPSTTPAALCTVLAIGIILTWSSAAQAYRTIEDTPEFYGDGTVRWKDDRVAINVAESEQLTVALVDEAAKLWNDVSCSQLTLEVATSAGGAKPQDGENTVAWIRNGWKERGFSDDSPALTDSEFAQDSNGVWQIVEADIYLNAQYFHGQSSNRVLVTILAHELGHVIGLEHPCEVVASSAVPACGGAFETLLMNPVYSSSRSQLAADDKAGVCYLYPGAEPCTSADCLLAPVEGGACESGPSCAAPATCESGACSRGNLRLGDPCDRATECSSGTCLGYCTITCTSSAECQAGENCVRVDGQMGACVGVGGHVGGIGERCDEPTDCESGLCLQAAAEPASCTARCASSLDCPAGWACSKAAHAGGEILACVPEDPDAAGWSCGFKSVGGNGWGSWILMLLVGAARTEKRVRVVLGQERARRIR